MTEYWIQVDQIMESGYEGILNFLMMYDEEFNQGSAAMRENWLEDWDLAINQALAYLDALANGFGSLTGSVLGDIYQMSSALSDLSNQMADVSAPKSSSGGGGRGSPTTTSTLSSEKSFVVADANGNACSFKSIRTFNGRGHEIEGGRRS